VGDSQDRLWLKISDQAADLSILLRRAADDDRAIHAREAAMKESRPADPKRNVFDILQSARGARTGSGRFQNQQFVRGITFQ